MFAMFDDEGGAGAENLEQKPEFRVGYAADARGINDLKLSALLPCLRHGR
jgi:hypothetical protein